MNETMKNRMAVNSQREISRKRKIRKKVISPIGGTGRKILADHRN